MRSTYAAWSFGTPRRPSKWPLAVFASVALAIIWWAWPTAPPAAPRDPAPDWKGLWVNGEALLRVGDGLRGEFSPDGKGVVAFAARAAGNSLTFVARLDDGRRLTLRMSRNGETARLVGTPDYEGEGWVAHSPASKEEREREEERRRGRAGRLLSPVDFGNFSRAP